MKFENTETFNWEGAFRGLRNPMDSWLNSDSHTSKDSKFIIGENDMNLAQRMIKGGTEQSKFLRQIFVSVDITAPRYWWSEFDTYKIGTVSNSCSTMHKLSAYPITLDMFEIDLNNTELSYWNTVISHLESLREKYKKTKDYKWFRLLKQELPEAFLQKRTITLNYAVLRKQYMQRKSHKLICWNTYYIEWIKSLSYSKDLIMYE